jgi:S-adenosylmethionine decarboxylase
MSANTGIEWIVDAAGCRAEPLRDRAVLQSLFDRLVADLQLNPLGEARWHCFPGEGGVTGFVLLAESHLAIHTRPEAGAAAVNLFCCRPRPAWPWDARLRELLGATHVRVRAIERKAEAK